MTYVSQAVAAKTKARDILRTQMATRILERLNGAEKTLTDIMRAYVERVAMFARYDKDDVKAEQENTETREEVDLALASVEGLTDKERSDLTAANQKSRDENDAANDKRNKEGHEARTKSIEDYLKRIVSAREEVARHQDNLQKLETGKMKVNKEELDTLTAELIDSGRVEAGEAEEGTEGAVEAEDAE